MCYSIELRSVAESRANYVPVLRLHEDIGHPVVIVSQRVTERLDANILANETTSPETSAEHGPIHCLELSAAEMSSHARS